MYPHDRGVELQVACNSSLRVPGLPLLQEILKLAHEALHDAPRLDLTHAAIGLDPLLCVPCVAVVFLLLRTLVGRDLGSGDVAVDGGVVATDVLAAEKDDLELFVDVKCPMRDLMVNWAPGR